MESTKDIWFANTHAADGIVDTMIYCAKALVPGIGINYLIFRVEKLRHVIWPLGLGSYALLEAEKRQGDRYIMNRISDAGFQSCVVGIGTLSLGHLALVGLKYRFSASNSYQAMAGSAVFLASCFGVYKGARMWQEDVTDKIGCAENRRFC